MSKSPPPFSRQTVHGLTVAEAAVILGCTEANVRAAVRSGKIAARRLRIGWILHPESVDSYRLNPKRRFRPDKVEAAPGGKAKKAKKTKKARRGGAPVKTMIVTEPLTGEQLEGEILSEKDGQIVVKTRVGTFCVERT